MNTITTIQALELIDQAALEDMLYHHNGGQAYIRMSMLSNALMVIDHSMADRPVITFHDGTSYFAECNNYNWEHSKRLRDHGSLAEWYTKYANRPRLDIAQ
jgi:hypothetical protein